MEKYKKIVNILFVITFSSIILILFLGIFVRGQKLVSKVENRVLERIPRYTSYGFLDGTYQTKLEDSLNDQILFGSTIKLKTKKIEQKMISALGDVFEMAFPKQYCNGYVEIANKFYMYKCNEYIVESKINYQLYSDKVKTFAKNYEEHLPDIKTHLYFVTTPRAIDFNIKNDQEIYTSIKNTIKMDKYDSLKIDSYEEYENFFYKTDHHWNYKGSYQGYKDIIKMLLGNDEKVLKPNKTTTYDTNFYGSHARKSAITNRKEKFTVYDYKLPKYTTYINGKESKYGNKDLYQSGQIDKEEFANHYGSYYGLDYAEIIYDFNNKDKENLLIISASYSNAINDLVASHFNKTFIIDLRYYYDQYNKKLNLKEYIKKNNIDKFLFIGDVKNFIEGEFYIKE